MKSTLLAVLFIVPIISLAQTDRGEEVKIYPNPTSHEITIEGVSNGFERMLIYDASGKSVREEIQVIENSSSKIVLDLSALNRGVYYFKVQGKIEKVFKE